MRAAKLRLRSALLLLAGVAVAALALLVVFARRTDQLPADNLRQSWARRGVERPNVVLVTLDTTRADHLGCYGDADAETPTLDTLARRGVLFTQAATVAPLTLPAHASILTGLYPTYHGVRLNGGTALGQGRTTLATALLQKGYQTGAFLGAFVLDGRWGLNQGFSHYDDQFDLRKFKRLDLAGVQRPGNQVMDAALSWLDGHKQAPFFAWIHLYDAHSPYEPPEPFLSRFRSRGPAALYDGEIAFADQQLGRLVAWLEQAGLDQKTILVVLGDHGEGLGSHGEGTHGYFVYDYAVHVPFLVVTPFEKLHGVRVASQVSLVDVFPTVLALAGIDSAAKVHGRSLLPLMRHPQTPEQSYAYSEAMTASLQYGWGALHSLRTPRYKLVEAPRPELFDLTLDPEERSNVIDRHPDIAREMTAKLEQLMAETGRDAPPPETADLDQDTVARLAALGYLGGPAAPVRSADTGRLLADPKDKLEVFTAVQRAGELMAEDQAGSAAGLLESALRQEPAMPQALLMLGTCYSDLGRKQEAKAQFDRVLKDDPRSVQGLLGLANLLLEEGASEDVVALCRRTLALDDRNTQAYALLADVYIDRHDPARALPYLEKAVAIQPKLTQSRLNLAACLIDLKQLARARESLEAIVREQPRFPGAQFNLGVLLEEQGRLEDARRAYAAEVAAYPDSFKARFNLGKLESRLGNWSGSIAEMREVVRIAPRRSEGYLFLARGLLHEQAPLAEVQAQAEKGLALAKTGELQAFGFFLMADVWSRRQQPERVEEALRRARAAGAAGREGSRHAMQND